MKMEVFVRRCNTVSAPILEQELVVSLAEIVDLPFQQLFPFRSPQSRDDCIHKVAGDATRICFSILKNIWLSDTQAVKVVRALLSCILM
jgi:hypothetical protein